MEDMNSFTFIDVRVLCLEDRVAVALRRLYSSESTDTLRSSVGVSESAVMSVTKRSVAALCERARHHILWPISSETDNIKSVFDKIHNMDNCCGVICTTHFPFAPNYDHEKDGSLLMQVVVDPGMRFRNIFLSSSGSMNLWSILHDSNLFKKCEKGSWLNGRKLKAALDGSEAGEYIIGDAGYSLLPPGYSHLTRKKICLTPRSRRILCRTHQSQPAQ